MKNKKLIKLLFTIDKNLIEIKQALNIVDYNFDVTSNWTNGNSEYSVTDEISFINYLTNISSGNTNISVTDFNLTGNRLRCNLTATMFNFIPFHLSNMQITSVKRVGNLSNFERLSLNSNNLQNFDYENELPNNFKELELANNQLTIFNKQLPITLHKLDLENNLLNTQSYVNMETWANNLPIFTNQCAIIFTGNTSNISGTNLETILLSKNCSIIY